MYSWHLIRRPPFFASVPDETQRIACYEATHDGSASKALIHNISMYLRHPIRTVRFAYIPKL